MRGFVESGDVSTCTEATYFIAKKTSGCVAGDIYILAKVTFMRAPHLRVLGETRNGYSIGSFDNKRFNA
jgi:hypothetical protein